MKLAVPPLYWSHTATVYTPDTTGAYTVLAKSDLDCRLAYGAMVAVWSGMDIQTGLPSRRLTYPISFPDYVIPDDCQVEIDGIRWQARRGTEHDPAPYGEAVYHAVDVSQVAS